MITYYIFETTCNYQVVAVINISIITIIIIIIKRRKQGCSKSTFVTQKAPCLKIIIIRKVSLPLEMSPCLEWSLFWISGTAPLIGMFSLSGTSAKKVIRRQSSFALVNYSTAIYWFFEIWLPVGISFKLMSWLCRTRALIRTFLRTRVYHWLFFCKKITKHYVEFHQQVHIWFPKQPNCLRWQQEGIKSRLTVSRLNVCSAVSFRLL